MNERERADAVYDILLTRQGEQWVQPRIERTQKLLDYLDNPQRTYRVVHVTGTNGKTSTSRIIESLIRAHGLRTGMNRLLRSSVLTSERDPKSLRALRRVLS